jgi:hypothetical protein
MSKSAQVVLIILLGLTILGVVLLSRIIMNPQENQISEKTQSLIRDMRNEDVIWTANYVGIWPKKLIGPTSELRDSSEDINPLLIDALRDPNRFVAAHVLLFFRTPGTDELIAGEWAGLKVQLDSNGKATFEGNNLMQLQRYWKERLHQ